MQNQVNNNISSQALSPHNLLESDYKDVFYQLEQSIGADVENVNLLMQQGIITQQQGQYLIAQLAGKAQQLNLYKSLQSQNKANSVVKSVPESVQEKISSMDLFHKERPGFFDEDGRVDIREYLKNYDLDKDEILQISNMVENLEKSAVDKYLKKSAYDKTLNDENEIAKGKLIAYAQTSPSNSNNTRVFSREEIGNMSGEEFTRNEKLIMEQLKQGLIK